MKKQISIIVMRHPEKDGDCITGLGAQQAFVAAQAFKGAGYEIDRLFYSGAHRTNQAALIVAAGMGQCNLVPEKNTAFNFAAAVATAYGGNSQPFIDELKSLKEKGCNTIDDYCKNCSEAFMNYVKAARKNLTNGILAIAAEMETKGEKRALALSHSPYTELTAIDITTMNMGLGECDAVEYVVEDDQIVASDFIPAPIAGKSLV